MNDDKKLIERYIAGFDDGFEQLYNKYKRPLYSYLAKFLNSDRAMLDDIFQETWSKVIKNINKYKDNQNFLAWVITISRNLTFDQFRKSSYKSEKVEFDESYIGASFQMPDQGLYQQEFANLLNEHVQDMATEQKEVYLLRSQGLSFKDIAKVQDVSLNTALGRMHIVVNKLRPIVKSYFNTRN